MTTKCSPEPSETFIVFANNLDARLWPISKQCSSILMRGIFSSREAIPVSIISDAPQYLPPWPPLRVTDVVKMFSYAHRGMLPKTIPSLYLLSGESRYVAVYGSLEEAWDSLEERLLR